MTHWEQKCKKSVNSITENIFPFLKPKDTKYTVFLSPCSKINATFKTLLIQDTCVEF